jgi:hypothetical protein
VGQVGAERHLALAAEMDAQDAAQLAQGAGLVAAFADRPRAAKSASLKRTTVWRPWIRMANRWRRVLTCCQVSANKRLEHRILLAGLAPPEQGHRHQLDIEPRIGEGRPCTSDLSNAA